MALQWHIINAVIRVSMRESLRALISFSEPAGGSRESFLEEVVLEIGLKVKEIWMIEIAP